MMIRSYTTTAAAGGPVTASLVASRTSGPAPLAVHFDATGTTHTDGSIDVIRSLGYYFAYNDTSPGNWTYSQNGTHVSKNYDRGGPIGAHVYETPGTYTAKVRARDASGNVSDAQVTITVSDPDSYFAGTNTVCLSRNTDHTGAPAGASQQSNVTVWPTFASNTRYLLHAGQDFSSLGRPQLAGATNTLTNVAVGKYGSGASPIVSGFALDGEPPGASRTTWSSNITVSDLNLNGARFVSTQSHTDVLLQRLTNISASGETCVEVGAGVSYYSVAANSGTTTAANIYLPVRTFLVDCTISGGLYGVTCWGRGTAIMGCQIHAHTYHCIRLWNCYKGAVRHNWLYGPGVDYHQLKLHSGGTGAWDDRVNSSSHASAYNVVSENKVGDTGQVNSWAVAVAPAGEGTTQGVKDCIVEDNYFAYNFGSEVVLGGLRLTSRGNTGVGTVNEDTSGHAADIPGGWDGPYYTGGASITTEAPA
jgi:hypothetical protein